MITITMLTAIFFFFCGHFFWEGFYYGGAVLFIAGFVIFIRQLQNEFKRDDDDEDSGGGSPSGPNKPDPIYPDEFSEPYVPSSIGYTNSPTRPRRFPSHSAGIDYVPVALPPPIIPPPCV